MSWRIIIILLLAISQRVISLICSRYPANTLTAKSPVDDNFGLSMSGSPQTYLLGQGYNISVNAYNGQRFISFILALENENGITSFKDDLGHFELADTVESRYSPNCINMVENTNTNPKTRVEVVWVAPEQPGAGCVLIRATLLQHRDVWFMDDGGLTIRICEEVVDDVESQRLEATEQEQKCCACDEARYELTFERLWSRNLHPKDFPAKEWTTRFSDIVGASHIASYRFWEYGTLASEGMRELAEHGSTRTLEGELNMEFKSGNIRTIIKARGPAYPNINGQSAASVRVDPRNHLLSLASKIDPSPDWIVGFSGLKLCMPNCTWLEQKVINLYPWDVGTDAGATYIAADQPQVPPGIIQRMRSDFPSDVRSPFFDPTGAPMKPFAKLAIKRQRLYERLCEDEDSNNIGIPRECFTHPWTDWSECSVKCGEGTQFRQRVFKQPEIAKIYNCSEVITRDDRLCQNNDCRPEFHQRFDNNARWERPGPGPGPLFNEEEQFGGNYGGSSFESRTNEKDANLNKCNGRKCAGRIYDGQSAEADQDGDGYNSNLPNSEQTNNNRAWNPLSLRLNKYGRKPTSNADHQRQGENNLEQNNRSYFRPQKGSFGRQPTSYGYQETQADEINPQQNNRNYVGPQQSYSGRQPNSYDDQQRQSDNNLQQNNRNQPGHFSRQPTSYDDPQRQGDNNLEQNNRNYVGPEQSYSGRQATSYADQQRQEENNNLQQRNRHLIEPEQGYFNRQPTSYDNEQRQGDYNLLQSNRNVGTQQGYFGRRPTSYDDHRQRQGDKIFQQSNHNYVRPRQGAGEHGKELVKCFTPLEIYTCPNGRANHNAWYYNYCTDECTVFRDEPCDRNVNKFASFEDCESECVQQFTYFEKQQQQQTKCRPVINEDAIAEGRLRFN